LLIFYDFSINNGFFNKTGLSSHSRKNAFNSKLLSEILIENMEECILQMYNKCIKMCKIWFTFRQVNNGAWEQCGLEIRIACDNRIFQIPRRTILSVLRAGPAVAAA